MADMIEARPDETNVYWRMAEALSVWYVSWSIVTETVTIIETGPPYFLHLTANITGPFASLAEAEAEQSRLVATMPRIPWPKGTRVRRAWGRTKPTGTIERYFLGRDRMGRPFLSARVFWPSTRWLIDRKGTSSTLKVSALVAADQAGQP